MVLADTLEGNGATLETGIAAVREIASRRLSLGPIPAALTCALYRRHLLVDPTAEEEELSASRVTVVMDPQQRLVGLYKPGGTQAASWTCLQVHTASR